MPYRICPKCKTRHYRLSFFSYAYKDEKGFYCGWHCYNHRKDRKYKYKRVVMCNRDGKPLELFNSANDAAEDTGIDTKHIQWACREHKCLGGFLWKYEDEEVKK